MNNIKQFSLFQNVDYLGMLCLGAYVGGVINYGLLKIKDSDSYIKVSAAIFGTAFSGGVFIFLKFIFGEENTSKAIYMYPIGLVLSLLWLQVIKTIEEGIPSQSIKIQLIGWLHLAFIFIVTILIIVHLNQIE